MLHEDKVVSTLAGPNALVCAIHENHCYFYECKKARRALMNRTPLKSEKIRREAESSKTPAFCNWTPWPGVSRMAPGHFYVEESELDTVRASLLAVSYTHLTLPTILRV